MYRRAEILTQMVTSATDVEAAFAEALESAQRYGAKTYELRTATSYAHWLVARHRDAEAKALLAPLYASFSEGFDTRDLREAAELLAQLSGDAAGETDGRMQSQAGI